MQKHFAAIYSLLHGSLLHSGLEHGNFLNIEISQGSGCVGIVNDGFVENLIMNLSVKEF